MIRLIPSKIEAYDTDRDEKIVDAVFAVESFDEGSCTLKVTTMLCNGNVEEVLAAIRDAVKMLELSD